MKNLEKVNYIVMYLEKIKYKIKNDKTNISPHDQFDEKNNIRTIEGKK